VDHKFLDVNALAVFLDSGHIGHPYLRKAVMPGLEGEFEVLINPTLFLRARRVMTSQWGMDEAMADAAISDLARVESLRYFGGDGRTFLEALELSVSTGHDVYDCFLVMTAVHGGASHVITTDLRLKRVCEGAKVAYENPVPRSVLSQFGVSGRVG